MPFLPFLCQKCGHTFNELLWQTEVDPIECPVCHQNGLIRTIGEVSKWFPHSGTFNGQLPQGDFQKSFSGR